MEVIKLSGLIHCVGEFSTRPRQVAIIGGRDRILITKTSAGFIARRGITPSF